MKNEFVPSGKTKMKWNKKVLKEQLDIVNKHKNK